MKYILISCTLTKIHIFRKSSTQGPPFGGGIKNATQEADQSCSSNLHDHKFTDTLMLRNKLQL
uniref:Uncharacterized protein n=1 Tax=Oryza brachyantha TaxID=4533 RepID=J3LRG6_ORYBR